MSNIFSVVVHKEKKYYVAECPEVGTVSQGKTIEEAIENLKEATELYLEEFPIKKRSKPFVSFFEVTSYDKASKTTRT
jgi:predicted RNase H-like HicB family nuclease